MQAHLTLDMLPENLLRDSVDLEDLDLEFLEPDSEDVMDHFPIVPLREWEYMGDCEEKDWG